MIGLTFYGTLPFVVSVIESLGSLEDKSQEPDEL